MPAPKEHALEDTQDNDKFKKGYGEDKWNELTGLENQEFGIENIGYHGLLVPHNALTPQTQHFRLYPTGALQQG